MKILKFLFLLSFVLIMSSCNNNVVTKLNTLSKEEKKEGWELLFDGKTTDGWRVYKGGAAEEWSVIDGVLHNSNAVGSDSPGDIITNDKFKDFELYLEWSIDSGSNSGIFYHVLELDEPQKVMETGPEYQLIDETRYLERLEVDPAISSMSSRALSGSNYEMHAPDRSYAEPVGSWNTARIIVRGAHVEHWLNDVKVVEYELWTEDWYKRRDSGKWKDFPYYGKAEEGHIALQDHGGLTRFRNIKIRRL